MGIRPPLTVGATDAAVLRSLVASDVAGAAMARRARIVLLAADGLSSTLIAERLGCSRQTVITWRDRFRAEGLEGLRDAPRSGRPATVDEMAVLARTLEAPPGPGAARWSTRSLAVDLGISNAAVGGIWRARGILPAARGGVRFGTDPVLDATVDTVLGVHLGRAERVLALLVSAPAQASPGNGVPLRMRPDFRPVLAGVRPDPHGAVGDLIGFLAGLPLPRAGGGLALVAQPATDLLRGWVGGRPTARLHVVPPGRSWVDFASTMCMVAAATAGGTAAVADLARTLAASVPGEPAVWSSCELAADLLQ